MTNEEIINLKADWNQLLQKLNAQFDTDLDLQGVLFLIGVQELGKGYKNFSKDEKQDLMHVATCKLLSLEGYYAFDKFDEDQWPHYKQIMQLPPMSLKEQDLLLRKNIVRYFEESAL
jgi:hypothetical protein